VGGQGGLEITHERKEHLEQILLFMEDICYSNSDITKEWGLEIIPDKIQMLYRI
jgi:hypothetical protein